MIYIDNRFIHISILNPFKTINKLKGIFIPLDRMFQYGINVYYPFTYCPKPKKILIRCCNVMWKDKYDSPRYENPPYIWIHLFGFNLIWWWGIKSSLLDTEDYWEQALWYLYYYSNDSYGRLDHPDINKAKESWPWQNYDTKESTWNNKFLIK